VNRIGIRQQAAHGAKTFRHCGCFKFNRFIAFIDKLIVWVRAEREVACRHDVFFNDSLNELFMRRKNSGDGSSYAESPGGVADASGELNRRPCKSLPRI